MAKKYIREEDLSGGFKVPFFYDSEIIGMSTCNVCKNRLWGAKGKWKCKIYGDCLKEIKENNVAKCDGEIIDKDDSQYNLFFKLRQKEESKKEENKG